MKTLTRIKAKFELKSKLQLNLIETKKDKTGNTSWAADET